MSAFIWDDCQLTFDGFQYNELHDAYVITINREGGSTAVRKLACAWGDAVGLAQSLRGNSVEVGGVLVYTEAASHPAIATLKVSSVNVQPQGASLGTGIWEQAHLTVAYDVPEFGTGSAPTTEELKEQSLDISAFNQQIDNEKVEFDNGDPVDGDVYTTVRVIEYRCTLYRQASLPLSAIAGLINKVNNATWEGVPAGYALYGGAEASRTITDEGAEEWTVSHVVFIGDQDQRQRVNPNTGALATVRYKNGGDNIIREGSFASVGI